MSSSTLTAAGIMPEKDTLSLLALKVAPNVFDLSSGQQHVSIRDQIIRAQILVRDLCNADPLADRILVVGAGVAGVTAALEAAARGKLVVVVDTAKEPFSLQRNAPQRFVGPFMYEWPASFFDNQSYPPKNDCNWGAASPITPVWSSSKPLSGPELAGQLLDWLECVKHDTRRIKEDFPRWSAPDWWMEATSFSVMAAVKRFAEQTGVMAQRRIEGKSLAGYHVDACQIDLKREGKIDTRAFTPDYIVLGAGMGEENVSLPEIKAVGTGRSIPVKGPRFWGDDTLLDPATANQSIGVFGGGDGAIQDVLRALTGLDHPLEMIRKLEQNAAVRKLLAGAREQLLAMEQQSRLISTWMLGQGAYMDLDRACSVLAMSLCRKPVMRQALLGCLREGHGVVFQFVRESHFGKAYLLNRFLMHMLIACRARASKREWGNRMNYECHFGAEASASMHPQPGYRFCTRVSALPEYRSATGGKRISTTGTDYDFHEVAVRFGIVRNSTPGSQMVTLTGKGQTTRTSLSRIPLPFILPVTK